MGKLKDRWMRLRNFQSRDFWAMVFARPLSILLLLPVADCRWVTPNRLTVLSVLTKLAGIGLIALHPSYAAGIWAAVLVNLGLVFDNMDGTLARYHRSGTLLGYYFDKASDAVTMALLLPAMGYRAFLATQHPLDLFLPAMAACGGFVAGYAKWVADRVVTDIKLQQMRDDRDRLQQWVAAHLEHDRPAEVPRRSALGWLRWIGWALLSILFVNEVDIFLWIAIALLTTEYWIVTRLLSVLLALGILAGPVAYAVKIYLAQRRAQ
jgi:phosphatidylglycerophosphate synthase